MGINILFAFAVSVTTIFIIGNSTIGIFAYQHPPSYHYAMISVAFLLVWFLYGLILGYMRRKDFLKFISLYWSILGFLGMVGYILPSSLVEILRVVALPAVLLIFAPTYGLRYFIPLLNPQLLFALLCLVLSWSSGAIGYLLGTLLSKLVLRVSTKANFDDK